MARPQKQGIEYFPYDVDLDLDDKLGMIIGEFGFKGELLFTKICAWLYKHNGYYTRWTEDEQLRFLRRYDYCCFSAGFITEVVPRCLKWGLFDKAVFEMFQVLTSRRIQKTWIDATRKRKVSEVEQKLWLFPAEETPVTFINTILSEFPAEETPKKVEETPQSKVKESKVNKEAIASADTSPPADEQEYKILSKEKTSVYRFIRDKKPSFIEPYKDFWNLFAKERGFPTVETISDKRRKKLKKRLSEPKFNIIEILRKAKESDLITTGTWFTFDWLIETENNYLKVIEGNYDNRTQDKKETNGINKQLKEAIAKETVC